MFPGMFMRKPDKAAALKQLKSHVVMFQAWVVVIQVTPYVLHFLSTEKEELKLELYLLTLPRQRFRGDDREKVLRSNKSATRDDQRKQLTVNV
ncbi:Mitochondrial import receptor subunit TOM6 [Glycine max]|nr:Mitochondrial import receptor subunit TOM6 [Glycine max]